MSVYQTFVIYLNTSSLVRVNNWANIFCRLLQMNQIPVSKVETPVRDHDVRPAVAFQVPTVTNPGWFSLCHDYPLFESPSESRIISYTSKMARHAEFFVFPA